MKRCCWKLAGIALSLLVSSAAQAQAPPGEAALDELMHQSGLWTQLPQFEATVREGFAAELGKLHQRNDEVAEKVRKAVAAAYSGDRLRATVRRELGARLSAEDVAAVLAWLGTDLGVRITALEERAGEPEQEALRKEAEEKLLAETPAERVGEMKSTTSQL